MSQVLEYEGKSVDQALETASQELNLPAKRINYEVVTYGSSGIFGLVGVKKAKIKVFVPSGMEVEAKTEDPKNDQPAPPSEVKGDMHDIVLEADLVEKGVLALQKMADSISEGATANVEQREGKLYFTLTGGESGVLIGKRGQTLEALQYLLEKIINKKSTQRVRVLVDVEGYLEKRKSNLQQMALRMADKARRTKKPVTIGQMNSHDRRIVHIQLKDEKGVRTQSIGDGYYRKLMIFPKKSGGHRRHRKDN